MHQLQAVLAHVQGAALELLTRRADHLLPPLVVGALAQQAEVLHLARLRPVAMVLLPLPLAGVLRAREEVVLLRSPLALPVRLLAVTDVGVWDAESDHLLHVALLPVAAPHLQEWPLPLLHLRVHELHPPFELVALLEQGPHELPRPFRFEARPKV